ncbi:MAG: PH domain-containing protein [Acidimicrobiales bacterium]
MAFPRRLLNHGEELVVDVRPHWRYFLGPALLLGLAVGGLVASAAEGLHEWLQLTLAGVTLAALAWFTGRYARWASTSFVVTTDRLIHRSGVLSKHGIEVPLERVNSVFSSQSLFERLLRSGDLVIESGGERGRQRFGDVPRPAAVQQEIYRQIEDNQRRMSTGRLVGDSVTDQLSRLDDLRRRGIVTQAEFDAKKTSLLDRL